MDVDIRWTTRIIAVSAAGMVMPAKGVRRIVPESDIVTAIIIIIITNTRVTAMGIFLDLCSDNVTDPLCGHGDHLYRFR
jgi:hypothetical protein